MSRRRSSRRTPPRTLPEPDCRYPVIVEVTNQHVVWVEAEDTKEALRRVQQRGDWYDLLDDQETLVTTWPEFRAPCSDKHSPNLAQLDWELVYEGDWYGAYQGLKCDAHVASHEHAQRMAVRAEELAACKAAGHINLEVRDYSKDRAFCPTCGWLELAAIVADLRATSTRDGEQP